MSNREFKGVWIPGDLYLNDELSWTEKLVILEVDSFSRNGLPCFISNEHLCNHIRCSASTIEKSLKRTEELGYIIRNHEIIDGHSRRILRMNAVLNYESSPSKTTGSIRKKLRSEPSKTTVNTRKKVRHTNTSTNTSNNSMKEGKLTSKPNAQECYLYFAELGVKNHYDEADAFKDWYDQTGWTLKGGNKIKDWKATARNWVRRQKKYEDATATKGFKESNFNAENIKSFVTEG
tara:strand:- start:7871 stop:8572 length:702 start_codon:yes stop_codon:yes gene_type:complete